jgi:hypothetical protein
MTGIQFFLLQPAAINPGHILFINTPWALTGITQGQFWPLKFPMTYGDGAVQDILSVDISEWEVPGILYGLTSKQCTPDQIAAEVLAQIRSALDNGNTVLPDSMIHSWVIDPDVSGLGTANPTNNYPLFINTKGSWALRPDTATNIPNFFLAGDYVHAYGFDLACMETANEGGRRAANAILSASNSSATPATVYLRYQEPLLLAQWAADDLLFAACRPNEFDLIDPYVPACSPL